MKKIALFVGVGIGFVLGSRAGNGPYKKLEAKVNDLRGRPEMKDAVVQVRSTPEDQAGTGTHNFSSTLPSSAQSETTPTDTPDAIFPTKPSAYDETLTPLTEEP
jgi:hypothetical protein